MATISGASIPRASALPLPPSSSSLNAAEVASSAAPAIHRTGGELGGVSLLAREAASSRSAPQECDWLEGPSDFSRYYKLESLEVVLARFEKDRPVYFDPRNPAFTQEKYDRMQKALQYWRDESPRENERIAKAYSVEVAIVREYLRRLILDEDGRERDLQALSTTNQLLERVKHCCASGIGKTFAALFVISCIAALIIFKTV